MNLSRAPWPRALAAAVCLGLVLVWAGSPAARAQAQPPFLWKATSPQGIVWLFGTIHVPDARVLTLHPTVAAAFAESARVLTEIPLDAGAQAAMAGALLLPGDQRLRDRVGAARFARLETTVRSALLPRTPLLAPVLVGMLDRLRPWAAMAQLATLEYLPDLLQGRVSLDARLYADAEAAGKQVGGLETVQEQAAVFDAFSEDEQIALLDAALTQVETPDPSMTGAGLVALYLRGNADGLTAALAHGPDDAALARKFRHHVLVARNQRMAARIDALRREHPGEVQFVAVGTLHLVGPDNLPQLLAARGYDIARVGP
ncbi:MAG: TraB/GumN family protein [Acidobacteria bacterium]|nr:TraB/GumN family protein [Acidobacteriota bacterium]